MSNTPSKAEIEALAQQHLKAFVQFNLGEVWFEGEVEFARAVLAKWGSPAVAGKPVAWLSPWRADQVTTDYDAYGEHGIPLYTAPQPQAGAVPLTDEYPALVCDYCGALTPDPWHSSGMLHGKMSKHIHSCDACAALGAARAQVTAAQQGAAYAATPECLPCSDHGAVGNSGFDHKTAADFLSGKTVSDEALRKFVAASRWAHDERAALSATLLAMHGVLTSREAEIALLKKALLEAEAAPQPAPATQQAGATKEHVRLVRVIADKIEDGTLFQSGIYSNKDLARFVRNVADAAAPQPAPALLIARSLAEWHEQDGNVAWWAWNGREWAGEPAWIGTPNCEDWPGYHTHWTPHPEQPVCAALAAQGGKA